MREIDIHDYARQLLQAHGDKAIAEAAHRASTFEKEGKKDEAKAEFDTTRAMQKAVEDTLAKKLERAQEKAKTGEEAPGAPPASQ